MSSDTHNTYIVEGMSCGHCEVAVRAELERVQGVDAVEVDLAARQVVVRGRFADADVRAAIDEAGYRAA